MLRFDEATDLMYPFKFGLSERLINSLWVSDALLFPELIGILSIVFYNFIEFIMLLYPLLVICFAQYKEKLI